MAQMAKLGKFSRRASTITGKMTGRRVQKEFGGIKRLNDVIHYDSAS
jgi:hypothetical protein